MNNEPSGNSLGSTAQAIAPFTGQILLNQNGGNYLVAAINRLAQDQGFIGQNPLGGAQGYTQFKYSTRVALGVYLAKSIKDTLPGTDVDLTAADLGTVSPEEDLEVWVWAEVVAGTALIDLADDTAYGDGYAIQQSSPDGSGFPVIRANDGSSPTSVIFRVKNDGGSAGSDGVYATFTYELYDVDDDGLVTAIASGVEVQSRPIAAEMAAAADGTFCVAVLDPSDDTYKILSFCIAETYTTAECETSPGEEAELLVWSGL